MSEYVCKPKICLNLPFGSEESHQRGWQEFNPILHPSIHLPGTRYPKGSFPTRPWMGLDQHLQWYIPYSVHIAMTHNLLDPCNVMGYCVFPWNEEGKHSAFSNLGDIMAFVAAPDQQQEMQKRFWENVALFFRGEDKDEKSLTQAIHELMHNNVEETLRKFEESQSPLTRAEKTSLAKIGKVYLFYQKDATLLHDFCSRVLDGIAIDEARTALEKHHAVQFADYPLTHGLYLLFHAIGEGEFNQILATILKGS